MADSLNDFRHPEDPGWESYPDWSDADASCGSADDRRRRQRAENAEIGEGADVVPTARMISLQEMLDEYVFITDGSQVAPLARPHAALSLSDFKNAVAGSKHWVEAENGEEKPLAVSKVWLEHPDRMEAEAMTFRAGGERITSAPNSGKTALNLWVPLERVEAPEGWSDLCRPFVEHIKWLWGDDADKFLDWLAHIEQYPGELPHYGWVHISREHGKGRNWISSVLSRVWRGYVAASLDLVSILSGGFNGRMSRKILAIVDEINEGGNASYKHAQTLRQIVTAEHREINPKYARQYVEYNSCRWLMFSNHTGAIPLGEDDRRFWIVAHQGAPKEPDYYATLYRHLKDPQFIAAVSEFLRRRNIDGFKPGERPPMNEAKAELVAFSQSEDDLTLRDIAAHWPVDVITNMELRNLLDGDGPDKPAGRHAIDRAGFRKLEARKIKVYGQGSQRAYIIRNHAYWLKAAHQDLKLEIERFSDEGKRDSLGQ